MDIEDQTQQSIRSTVQSYVEGMTLADEISMRRAFHPECKIIGHYEGTLEWLSLGEFIEALKSAVVSATPAQPDWEMLSLDVTGDIASVKVRDEFLGLKFTDYLSLLKLTASGLSSTKLITTMRYEGGLAALAQT